MAVEALLRAMDGRRAREYNAIRFSVHFLNSASNSQSVEVFHSCRVAAGGNDAAAKKRRNCLGISGRESMAKRTGPRPGGHHIQRRMTLLLSRDQKLSAE